MTTGLIIGLIGGLLLGSLIAYLAMPKLLFKESESKMSFEDTVSKLEMEVEARGWKTPAIHDLQATMKKFDKDVRKVKVFEICHPELSYQILSQSEERIVANMMPCRIAVYEKEDGSIHLSRMNSGVVAKPMKPVVRRTMSAAAEDVEKVIAKVLGE